MERTYSAGLKAGKKAKVQGWIERIRDMGGLTFFILRDREGSIQVTAKKGVVGKGILKTLPNLGREDCVTAVGTVKASNQAPGGRELIPDSIEIVGKAKSPLPIDIAGKIESNADKRFDYRFMDMRNPKVQAIFRVRDVVLAGMRDFFGSNGFVEVHTPVIQAAGAEGGATLFPLIYYNQEAFLRQSPQLYKQMLMSSGLDRVYEIGPAFRAEKFHTRRHVAEFISVDAEMAWVESEEDILKVLEQMVVHVFKGVLKGCRTELGILGAKITVPELPMKRITYDEAIEIVGRKGVKIKWGDDFMDAEEKVLGEGMTKKGHEWYFVKKFPSSIKPFYIMYDGKLSRGFDMVYGGMEMASGGQREHRHDVLVKVMKEKGLEPSKFKFYLDSFQYGIAPHGGFGFGLERLVQQMLGLENIKEAILFPRTPERLVP